MFFSKIVKSAREFKNLRSVVCMAMLLALRVVLSVYSLTLTPTLRISVSFLAEVVVAYLFGPVPALTVGAFGDILQFFIKPTGPYFWGWTLSAGLAGLVYGVFLYGYTPERKGHLNEEEEGTKDESRIKRGIRQGLIEILLCVSGLLISVKWVLFELTEYAFKTEEVTRQVNATVKVIKIIIIVVFCILLVLNTLQFKKLSLVISTLTAATMLLAWYTEKKELLPGYAFFCVIGFMAIIAVANIIRLLNEKNIDTKYVLRVLICMTIVAGGVNVCLGTYWCKIMYGKAFLFYLPSRLIKNLIQLPINIVLTYCLINAISEIGLKKIINEGNK